MKAALLAGLLLAAAPAQARTVLEALDASVAADAGFTPEQRRALADALRARFADYGLQTDNAARADAVKVALTMLVEGSFDEQSAERSADVAFAAYQAVARGAPAEVVEGIGLYGYRKQVPADRLAAWANGYRQMTEAKVQPEVAADLVRATMENGWDDKTFDTLKWSLVQAAKQRFDQRAYATWLLGNMEKGGKGPGALTADAQAYFRKLAKTGAKPALPEYHGVFSPKPAPPPEAKPAPDPAPEAKPQPRPAPKLEQPKPEPKKTETVHAAREKPKPTGFASLWPGLERSSKSYLGTPYVWGGVTHAGIDCSGLTQNTYSENAVRIPRVSKDQWKAGSQVGGEKWREGDLVFFNTLGHGVSHVGMVVDAKGPRFIHASSSKGVVIADLSKNYYKQRYLGARRIVP